MPKRETTTTGGTAVLDNLAPPPKDLYAGVIPTRACENAKFQKILDYYNGRGEPDQSLSGVVLYIWRQFPKTDAKANGKPYTYIEKIEGVDDGVVNPLPSDLVDYITSRHGGGRYRVSLNDKNLADLTQVAMTTVKIDELQHNPILDPRELVRSDPQTAAFITRQLSMGLLAKDDQGNLVLPTDSTSTATGGGSDAAEWRKTVQAAMNKSNTEAPEAHATKRAIDMIADTATEQLKKAAGPDPLALFTAMAAAMPKGDNSAVLVALIESNTRTSIQMMQNQMELFKLHLAPAAAPATTEDAQGGMAVVERILSIIDRTSNKSDWLDQIKSMMPMLLPFFLAGRGPQPNGITAPGSRPMMDTGAGYTPTPQPAGGPPNAQKIEDLAAHAYMAIQNGQDGGDYAHAIDVFFGPGEYDSLRAIGKATLLTAMLNTRHGQQLQAMGAAFDKFVDDFLAYGNAETAAAPPPAAGPAGAV